MLCHLRVALCAAESGFLYQHNGVGPPASTFLAFQLHSLATELASLQAMGAGELNIMSLDIYASGMT
jgi:hypothetical protein